MIGNRPYSAIIDKLRRAKLRPTRQRLALARLLFDGGDRHVTLAIPRLERRQRADQRATLGERCADLCG